MWKWVARSCGILVAAGCSQKSGPPPEPPALTVIVAHPLTDRVTVYTDLTGTVDQKDIVDVRPRVSGYVQEVKFDEGKEVEKDQILFVIDPVIYQAQLQQAEGQAKVYEAQLRKAEADLARNEPLAKEKAISKAEFDSFIAARDQASAQLLGARGNIDQAKRNLEWTKVRSPLAGRAGRAYLTPGNLAVADQSVLTTVVSVEPMYAYFDVDEATVRIYQKLIAEKKTESVQTGAKVPVEIQLKGEDGYPHQGYLEFVDNRLNPSTGSLTIRGVFQNPKIPGTESRPLSAGFYCRGRIPLGQPREALLVPPSAVTSDQGRKVVYAVGADNRVVAKPVEPGPLFRGLQIIEKGLTADDRVVIRGMARVQPGVPVDPKEEAIPKPKESPGGQKPAPPSGTQTAGQAPPPAGNNK
ncbi:efflux RND transporter periplasmic adaptor subunit [Limnoglobus roseus]|uniref:Efflux RND transporter periplasmic adaptor subunit n=1 Tax=Limnoglobus roseus TaxID=2598579 RepID=A0A5C1A8X9_9BACT|nr:efflux RND transporter periplasmic adaptor subunit [Limnoglobus roseus]QEL14985.1 efflux RND transporter periplasmic adaptor subunit [Limnoglobus roseus]